MIATQFYPEITSMKKLSIVFVAAVSLAAFGCKKKGADCDSAVNNGMEVSKADMAKMPGMDDKMMGKMKDVALQHCKDDKWSEDALKCMKEAKSSADFQTCQGKLTPAQKEGMQKGMMEAMGMGGAMKEGGMKEGGPAEGSAAGSAGGSAAPAEGSAAGGSAAPAEGSAAGGSAAGSAAGSAK